MSTKKFFVALALVIGGGLAGSAAWNLSAQEGDRGFPPPEPALGVLASGGHREPAVTFLRSLGARSGAERKGPRGRLSLFIPGPEQLHYYGDKRGVVTFLKNLPAGGAEVRLLVRDVRRLESIGDKSSVLTFLSELSKSGGIVTLLLTDLPGLASFGSDASLLTFVRALPKGSSVHVYAAPRTLTRFGSDADLLAFFSALNVPFSVHLDDPDLDVFVKRWEALDQGKKGD
ncbi:MAG: hypothetical protein ACYTFG_00395 [Planctomycetota bacterium]